MSSWEGDKEVEDYLVWDIQIGLVSAGIREDPEGMYLHTAEGDKKE